MNWSISPAVRSRVQRAASAAPGAESTNTTRVRGGNATRPSKIDALASGHPCHAGGQAPDAVVGVCGVAVGGAWRAPVEVERASQAPRVVMSTARQAARTRSDRRIWAPSFVSLAPPLSAYQPATRR